jgi:hypothetical protein
MCCLCHFWLIFREAFYVYELNQALNMGFKKFTLILLLLICSDNLFSQGSTAIEITQLPGREMIDGRSDYNIPNWEAANISVGSCFSFLNFRIYYKHQGSAGERTLRFKMEITNNSPFEVFLTWQGTNGDYLKSGSTRSIDLYGIEEGGNQTISISRVKFYLDKGQREQYGDSYHGKNLNCGATSATVTNNEGGNSAAANDNGATGSDDGNAQEQESINSMMSSVMSNSSSTSSQRQPTTAETHEKHVTENNARANSSSTNSSGANNSTNTQAKRSGPSQAERDRQQKAADYARQQAKLEQENVQRQEYSQWKNQQNQKNAQVAAATAVGTISMLAILGKMIYQNMGMVNFDDVYQNKPALSISAEFGYSFLIQPIYFNSEVYDGVDYKNNTDYDFAWPVNFDFKFKLGYESEYVGAYGFGGLGIGASVVMHSFNAPTYNYGGQIFAGLPNVKGLFEYQGGGRAISQSYWMLEEESGSAYSSTTYNQIRYGARFTWGQFTRSHLSLGVINEGLTGVDDTQVQRIELPEAYNIEDRFITGYFLEYKKDHSFNFFVNIYPNYPFTGEVEHNIRNNTDTDYNDGSMYFLVGFHRSLDLFY